jgi:hypothetical protein
MSPGPFSSTAVLDGMSGILGYTRGYRAMAVDEHRGKPGYRKFYRPYP